MKRLAVLLLLVVACGTPYDPANPYHDFRSGSVEEITLTDGTRCAVAASGYGIGISCDWGER